MRFNSKSLILHGGKLQRLAVILPEILLNFVEYVDRGIEEFNNRIEEPIIYNGDEILKLKREGEEIKLLIIGKEEIKEEATIYGKIIYNGDDIYRIEIDGLIIGGKRCAKKSIDQ